MLGKDAARCLTAAMFSRMRVASAMTMPVERHCMWYDESSRKLAETLKPHH